MNTTKNLLLTPLAIVMMLSVSPLALAAAEAPVSAEKAMHTSSVTQDFVRDATIGGMFEIESSKLALQRATDPEVKSFAEQMIKDHTAASKEMKLAIKRGKIDPTIEPKVLDTEHQQEIDDLKKASEKDFDEDYVDAQEDAHDDAVAAFEKYAKDGDNVALKAFATKTLPTLQLHKKHIEQMEDKKD